MPLVKSTDPFIQRSLELLETAPSSTRISITYGSNKKEDKDKVSKHKADSFVSFKVFDPSSGALYKLKTHKVKDLSRVLTALGPHGVQITQELKKSDKSTKLKKDKATQIVQVRGFSSVLSNAEIEEEVEEIKEEPKKESSAKKGKKKKSKR